MANNEECDATLEIGTARYDGKTGQDCGHAEMHALHVMIQKAGGDINKAKNLISSATNKKVLCTSRPVCLKCGYVLKEMKFELGPGTKWGDATMGSTEWGAALDVRNLLKECGIDYEYMKNLK